MLRIRVKIDRIWTTQKPESDPRDKYGSDLEKTESWSETWIFLSIFTIKFAKENSISFFNVGIHLQRREAKEWSDQTLGSGSLILPGSNVQTTHNYHLRANLLQILGSSPPIVRCQANYKVFALISLRWLGLGPDTSKLADPEITVRWISG